MKKTFTLIASFLSLASIAQTSVFDVIATSPDHTILEQALIQEGLDVTLSDLNTDYTVFAPNDDAFTQFLTDNNLTAVELLSNPDLSNILLQHVVIGNLTSGNLVNGELVTAYGLDVTVDLSMGVMIDDAQVINPFDATAPNGVVHTIDYVLLPTYDDVTEVVSFSPDHTILLQALTTANLVTTLQDLNEEFTVFAPNDAAFTQFLADNNLTPAELLAAPNLADILLQHVVGGTVLSTDLTNGEVVTLYGLDVTVDLSMGVMIDDAEVIGADIEADNGVVHVLDYVLLPTYDDVTEVVSFSPDHTILLQALTTANLVTTLQDLNEEFTVFAPNDAAFTQFLADNNLTPAELLSAPNLSNILLHHVVGGTVLSTDLSNGPVTTLNTTDIFVDLTSGVMINDAEVIGADIEADNGVVHVLDYVLSLDYGLSILENNTNISAYPNPTSDKLFVDGIISGESFNIVSLDGKIVTSGNVLNNTLSVEDLTNGVYFVNFNESNVSIRVIKK